MLARGSDLIELLNQVTRMLFPFLASLPFLSAIYRTLLSSYGNSCHLNYHQILTSLLAKKSKDVIGLSKLF